MPTTLRLTVPIVSVPDAVEVLSAPATVTLSGGSLRVDPTPAITSLLSNVAPLPEVSTLPSPPSTISIWNDFS